MSTPADQPLHDLGDPAFDRAQRRLARLSRVADLALELAEATQARAMAALAAAPETEPASRPAADFIHAFDRAARAVRLCSLLESRFEGDLALHAEASAAAARTRAQVQAKAEEARRQARRTPREVRRDELRDLVGYAIHAQAAEDDDDDGARKQNLREAVLNERLDRDWDDARFLNRPLGAVVKDLCQSLGLDPDWSQFENEDWAIAETLAATPGSPFADWPVPWRLSGQRPDKPKPPPPAAARPPDPGRFENGPAP
jgi:hypothetical protein